MKVLIKNVLAFTFLAILTSIVFITVAFYIYKRSINNIKVEQNISILICGDSHTMSAVNDSILKGSVNISNRSQHYLYTHNVLKVFLKNNPEIRTLILGSSFHSFGEYDQILFTDSLAASFYPEYFPILEYEPAKLIIDKNFLGLVTSSKSIIKAITKRYRSYRDYPFVGHYYKSTNTNLNDSTVTTALKRHYYLPNEEEKQQEFSYYQKVYFKEIIKLCVEKNIKIIVINTPISNDYYKSIPKKFLTNYYSTITEVKPEITFWDFHALPLEKHCYGDADHLNSKGAEVLTLKIDSLLRNKAHEGLTTTMKN